jgi:hypothetical protein
MTISFVDIYKPFRLIIFHALIPFVRFVSSCVGMTFSVFDFFFLFYLSTNPCMFCCSPKELHFREYSLPKDVSSIVPSGANNYTRYYSKCFMLTIVPRISYERYHIYHTSANILITFLHRICENN